jgi:beta-glucosidase
VLPYTITPYQGIAEYLNGPLPPRPVNCTYTPDVDFYQPGNPCVSAASAQDCCAQCSGRVDCNAFTFVPSADCATPPASVTQGSSHRHAAAAPAAHGSKAHRKGRAGSKLRAAPAAGGACWIKPDNSGSTPHTGYTSGTCAPQPAPAGAWTVVYNATQDAAVAAALAAKFDVVVMNVATTSGEGSDRPNLDLPAWQDAMVSAVVAANKNTVVVARCPGACTMPWRDEALAILFQLLPGQEAGNALANALFGDVNPSGKLPVSFPASMNDTWLGNPVNPAQYPGVPLNGESFPTATFSEGVFFGYRWYDQQGTDPLWPFGHGLSYTSFGYSRLRVAGVASSTSNASVSITLTNTGGMAGSEVVQLYLGFPASTGEPPKVLRGFEKVKGMTAGAAATVTFTVTAEEVQVWDTDAQTWAITPGTYSVYVGSSSRDIRLTGSLTVQA